MDGISVSRKEAQGACLSLTLYEDTENKKKTFPECDHAGTWIWPKLRTGRKKEVLILLKPPNSAMCLVHVPTLTLTSETIIPLM